MKSKFAVESQGAAGCLIYHIHTFNRIKYYRISNNKQPYFETENKLQTFVWRSVPQQLPAVAAWEWRHCQWVQAYDFFTGSLEKERLVEQAEYKSVVVCISKYIYKPIQNLVSLVYSETSWVKNGLHFHFLTFRWPCIVINPYNKTN